jgi:hypothetical protein
VGENSEFTIRSIEFEILLDYSMSGTHQEAVDTRTELEEITELT